MTDRRQESYAVRLEAAEMARSRQHPPHLANGDEQKYAADRYFMSFTKGLPHNPQTGLLADPMDFVEFRRAIDDGFIDPFSDRVRHGARFEVTGGTVTAVPETSLPEAGKIRQWEAPTAGVCFELQGPDAQAVTMAPAPALLEAKDRVNQELVLEMAEVYELALLRDQPLNDLEDGGAVNAVIDASLQRLNALPYITDQTNRPRKRNGSGQLDRQVAFRGSSPGVEVGPYLSQFLLIGTADINGGGSPAQGEIRYGALRISQEVPIAKPGLDYMTTMAAYVAVQRGIKPDPEAYAATSTDPPVLPPNRPPLRFISTPRDLATYVHYDALYEAYLNACLILLAMDAPFDPAFDHLTGKGVASENALTRRNAGGFALYGGPHILTLVTEVATRALKAVRFQKFNNHIRLRPEALAARIELLRRASLAPTDPDHVPDSAVPPLLKTDVGLLRQALETNTGGGPTGTLGAIAASGSGNNLLPMAFPEGSPMHPAYGAGHATVAGACVTILKAFFDTSAVLADRSGTVAFRRLLGGDVPVLYRAPGLTASGPLSIESPAGTPLTLEGELNKLAANISIGRNMAGVHYFSDYYDSLRMGEAIAIGILEEQSLTYSTDPCVLSLQTFDGDVVRIGRR